MTPRLCSHCRQETFPDRWCQCDPRLVLSDFFAERCVYLMDEEGAAPPEDFGPMWAEALLG